MKRAQPSLRRLFGKQKTNERCVVAMVGDGINDAPVSRASVHHFDELLTLPCRPLPRPTLVSPLVQAATSQSRARHSSSCRQTCTLS